MDKSRRVRKNAFKREKGVPATFQRKWIILYCVYFYTDRRRDERKGEQKREMDHFFPNSVFSVKKNVKEF